LLGKGLICGVIARLFGYGNVVPWAVGLGLFQIGEFSFVLARVGVSSGALTAEMYALVLSAALVTMLLTPVVSRAAEPLYALSRRWSRQVPLQTRHLPRQGLQEHVVIAGGGRVGHYVADVLQRLHCGAVVIELDQRRVEQYQAAGIPVIYGDASHPVVLEAAAVARARLLVLTVPAITVAHAIVTQVRRLAPALPIVARAEAVEHMHRLHDLGVNEVVQPEFEAGLEMVRQALLALAIPAVDVEHYTDTVRAELYAPLYRPQATYHTLAQLRRASQQLALTWVRIPDESCLAGQTIEAMRIRSRTGASVVAVLRDGQAPVYPAPSQTLYAGDLVGVLGRRLMVLIIGNFERQ
ncbi:MAG: portal protein, partial [Candidatus Tectomicrobia bacterium]|nr:portal protein [Candidatus Tectomicrobia bacterium]